jgi:hypothetical protein
MKRDQADHHRSQALEGLFIVWKVRSSELRMQEDWEMFFAAGVLLILHDVSFGGSVIIAIQACLADRVVDHWQAKRGIQEWRLVWTMMGYAVRLRRKLYKEEKTGYLIRHLLGMLRVLDCLGELLPGV